MVRSVLLDEKERVQRELSDCAGDDWEAYRAHIAGIVQEAEARYGLHFDHEKTPQETALPEMQGQRRNSG